MRLAVVDDLGWPYQVHGKASFAERLPPELMPSEPTPSPVVVGTAAAVAALAAAFWMQRIDVAAEHKGTLIRP
jgi:hypothetical protein